MLEYFALTSFTEHLKNKMIKEHTKLEEFSSQIILQSSTFTVIDILMTIIAITISFMTAKIAYHCNQKSDKVVQIMAMLFGFFFSGMYLIYYFGRYVIGGGKC